MKSVLLLSVLIATVTAAEEFATTEATERTAQEPTLVSSVNERYLDGGYKYSFELSDGSIHEEEGQVKYGYISVKGFFVWNDEEGKHRINYSAGNKGSKYEVVEGPEEVTVPDYLAKIKAK